MQRLNASDAGFADAFDALVNGRREADADVSSVVTQTIRDVRARGDVTLAEMTQRFDGFDLNAAGWQIDAAQCKAAYEALAPELRDALTLAAKRIEAYHKAQLPENRDYRDADNVRLGARWSAVDAAGVYVPGGRAAYPSSVLMNAIPAKVAGVERIVMVTPTPGGETNQTVMAAAYLAGVDEIWRVGGAQAIAALAYGTERIRPVDVITGPGNAWVAEAKRQLYGVVGIDMVAGPSEILVVADAKNDPEWIAADLLSQAEHDPTSQSILFTDDAGFADTVAKAVDAQIATLATGAVARQSWDDFGAIVLVDDLEGEAEVVARAGELGRITVATNMAGRGTDIRLGPGVAELGGLHVLATERHDARRIDRQLFGRSGRQGHPGSGRAIVAKSSHSSGSVSAMASRAEDACSPVAASMSSSRL